MTRPIYSDGNLPPNTPVSAGLSFLAQDNAVKNVLLDGASAPLTGVATDGGDANALTANIRDFYLDGDFIAGQAIRFVYPAAANTGGVTIQITPVDGAGTASAAAVTKSLLTGDGSALVEDQLLTGLVVEAVYEAGAFRITSGIFGDAGASRLSWVFVASGTWTKPDGLADNTPVWIEGWGGGGGGLSGLGGGGAGYMQRLMRLSGLTATVTVTIAAGGSTGVDGGNSSFGTYLTAYGGRRAVANNASGRGGGTHNSGNDGGDLGGGGARAAVIAGGSNGPGSSATNIFGGGGGAVGTSDRGGRAVYGGGGGGGTAGPSIHGGNGGGNSESGVAPGGGGGANGAGARGEVRVWI